MFIVTMCSLMFVSCQKDGLLPSGSTPTFVDGNTVVSLTGLDNGRTINILDIEKLKVTLGSAATGYQYTLPKYDNSILSLGTTSQSSPTATGNFGVNAWNFTFFKPGTTTLVVNATSATDTIKVFEVTIVVTSATGGQSF